MLVYLFIFSLIIVFLYLSLESIQLQGLYFSIVVVILILFAGLRGEGVDKDHFNYVLLFDHVSKYSDFFNFGTEPASIFIPVTLKYLNFYDGYYIVTLIYAAIALILNYIAIKRFSVFLPASFLLYYSNYFLLHEMTQIRVGVAVAICILSINNILNKELSKFLLKILIACLFHYTAILFVFTYLINFNNFNKNKYLILLLFSFLVGRYVNIIGVISNLPFLQSVNKIKVYSDLYQVKAEDFANPLNLMLLINLFVSLLVMNKVNLIEDLNMRKCVIIFTKINLIGIISFWLFMKTATIGFRVSEIYSSVNYISFTYLLVVYEKRYFSYICLIIAISSLFLGINLFKEQLVHSYISVF